MKDFFKYILATVLGLVITGAFFTILGVVSLDGIAISSERTVKVKDHSVLVLALKDNIVERYQPSLIDQFLGKLFLTYGLDKIISSIRNAKENPAVKGIYLVPENFICSTASLQYIRTTLQDFKESGKFLVAYSGAYTQGGYYLASVADKIMINPSGSIALHGLSSRTMSYKEMLDKLGKMQVFRIGTYKSAVTMAKEKVEIERNALVYYPEQQDFLTFLLDSGSERYINSQLKSRWGAWYTHLSFLKNLEKKDYLHARMPFTLDLH